MRYLFSAFLILHSFGHIAVFLAYWKVLKHEEISSKTEILDGRVKLSEGRIRLLGLVWAVVGLAMAFMGVYVALDYNYLIPLGTVSVISLLLTITGLPDTKIGFLINLFLVPVTGMSWFFEWF